MMEKLCRHYDINLSLQNVKWFNQIKKGEKQSYKTKYTSIHKMHANIYAVVPNQVRWQHGSGQKLLKCMFFSIVFGVIKQF